MKEREESTSGGKREKKITNPFSFLISHKYSEQQRLQRNKTLIDQEVKNAH